MTAPFAAIEAATALGAVAACGNVDVTIGAATVRGIFDNAYQDPLGMAGSSPSLLLASSDATSVVVDSTTLSIDGASYLVVASAPDGAGLTRLTLQEAS